MLLVLDLVTPFVFRGLSLGARSQKIVIQKMISSSFFLIPYSFFLLPSSFEEVH